MKSNGLKISVVLMTGWLLSFTALASSMDQSMKEGRDIAGSALSSGVEATKNFKPEDEFEGFNSKPPESGYYHGVTSSGSNIGDKGNRELATSDLGKLTRESFINNPADKIDRNSDMIKNSDSIRDNAEVIAAGTSQQCVKQDISKVTFTSHSCSQDKSVSAVCTNTGSIDVRTTKVWTPETLRLEVNMKKSGKGVWTGNVSLPESGRFKNINVSGSTVVVPYNGQCKKEAGVTNECRSSIDESVSLMARTFPVSITKYPSITSLCSGGQNTHCTTTYNNGTGSINATFSISDTFSQGQSITVVKKSRLDDSSGNSSFKLVLTLGIEVEKTSYQPEIVWNENCPVDKGNAVKVREWCSQPGATRTVQYNGQPFNMYSDCWQHSEEWVVSSADTNTCSQWENDANCTVGTRACTAYIGSYCVKENISYQCQHTVKSEGWLCGDSFYCADGKCAAMQENQNGDFSQAVSALAAIAAAGKDVAEMDPSKVSAFTGKGMSCRKAAAGFSNCCKGGGWGSDVGLAHCNSEEKAIGKAKEKLLTIDVGEYCSRKVLGVCLQKKRTYCVFDSKLARIVQEQGRGGQLHISFGSASSPNCRGVTVAEMQHIDWKVIDYSDFYSELEDNMTLPDSGSLTDRIREQIQSQMNGVNQ